MFGRLPGAGPAVLTCYDAAFPPPAPPATDVVGFYIGGDTPHVWSAEELAAQPARYRLPIWVRSDPAQAIGSDDAVLALDQLRALGAPGGCTVVLDLETAVTGSFVRGFGAQMAPQHPVIVYGSSSTLFENPALAGYFVAKPGATATPAGCVAVQYAEDVDGGAYDLSWISSTVPLWDTRPPAGGSEQEETMPDRIAISSSGDVVAYVGSQGNLIVAASDSGHWTGPGDVTVCDVTDVALKADPQGVYGVAAN